MNSAKKWPNHLGSLHSQSSFFPKREEELSDFKTLAEIFHVKSIAQVASEHMLILADANISGGTLK